MKSGKDSRSVAFQKLFGGLISNKAKIIAGLLLGVALTVNNANAFDYSYVQANLDWAARDHGFNEGAACGVDALQGISGVGLPNVPFEYQILGNSWDRTNMMGAAKTAFRLGFVDAAVQTALCSQAHNPPVQQALAQQRDLIIEWFSNQ